MPDCLPSVKDARYVGNINITNTRKSCQRWDTQTPHKHGYRRDGFVDKRIDHNYCRNPSNSAGPWCYTTDPRTRWQYCNIPVCGKSLSFLLCLTPFWGLICWNVGNERQTCKSKTLFFLKGQDPPGWSTPSYIIIVGTIGHIANSIFSPDWRKERTNGRIFCRKPTRDIYRRAYKSLFTSSVR